MECAAPDAAPPGGEAYPSLGGAPAPAGNSTGWVKPYSAEEDPLSLTSLKKKGKKTKRGVVIRIA